MVLLAACAHPAPRPLLTPSPPAPPPTVAGAWFRSARAANRHGDLQMEHEEWMLEVRGRRVTGRCDRTVTILSADGRPFRCNGEISLTRRTRYDVEGRVEGARVEISEIEYEVDPGPCEDGQRMLDAYSGVVGADRLTLRWEGGEQVLARRAPAPDAAAGAPPGEIAGAWLWEHRSVDGNGDRRFEAEDWTIERDGDDLRGAYTSVVTYTSGDGRAFRCNGAAEFAARARFDFSGVIDGRRVRLKETAFVAEPGPCEPGLRRLGSYSGTFDGSTIVLDWGSGRQTLRRK